MNDTKIICPICGEALTLADEFCSNCGRRMFKKTKQRLDNQNHQSVWQLSSTARAVVLFCLSLILCVFSFLPLTKFAIPNNEGDLFYQADVVDSYIYFVESFRTRTQENVKDTYAFEMFYEKGELLEDDDIWPSNTKPNRQAQKISDDFVHYYFRINLMLEDNKIDIITIVSFVSSALYTIAVFGFVLFSLLNMINTFMRKRSFIRQCFYLLSVIPCLALIASFAMTDYDGFMNLAISKRMLGIGLILTLLISLSALVFFVIQRISVERARKRVKPALVVKYALVAISSLLLVVTLVMPMLSVKLKLDFAGDDRAKTVKRSFYAEYFADYVFTEEEFAWYEENEKNESNAKRVSEGKAKLDSFLESTASVSSDYVKRGAADGAIKRMTRHATAMSIINVQCVKGIAGIYILTALLGFSALLLFCNSMGYLLLGYEKRKTIQVTKIFCIALAVLNIVAMIVCVCMQNYFFNMVNLEYTIATRIGMGNIVGILVTLLLVATYFVGIGAKKTNSDEEALIL